MTPVNSVILVRLRMNFVTEIKQGSARGDLGGRKFHNVHQRCKLLEWGQRPKNKPRRPLLIFFVVATK